MQLNAASPLPTKKANGPETPVSNQQMKHSIAKFSILCLTVAIGFTFGLRCNVDKRSHEWVHEIRMGYAISVNDDIIRNSKDIAVNPMWRGNFGKTLLYSGFSGLLAEKKCISSTLEKSGFSEKELQKIVEYLQVSGFLEQGENQGLDTASLHKLFSTEL